jgi:hypothetical protein
VSYGISNDDDDDSGTIPSIMGSFTGLQYLWLFDNAIEGSMVRADVANYGLMLACPGTVPSELSEASGMLKIGIFSNYLTGARPRHCIFFAKSLAM